MSGWRAFPILFLVCVSCGSDGGGLLRVDVLTDFVPNLEFEMVEISVEGVDVSFRRPVQEGDEFLRGQRVGELRTAGEESVVLVGRLLDRAGGTVARRRVSVALRERSTQTLVFTRSCAEVTCPTADPAATECQGGVCVPPECSPENPDACAAGCRAATDCEAPSAACAEARCVDGVCLDAMTEGGCAEGEVCQPSTGCVVVSDGSDMGPGMDAGSPVDAATLDAAMDMGGADLGIPECTSDADCDDGAYCNGPERCIEGVCAAAEGPVICDDGVGCTLDRCDEASDSCVATPDDGSCSAEPGGSCDAAMGCQYPVCTPSNCVAGPCQTATCEGDVCVRTNLCGSSEICCGGSCAPAGCDDGNPCTDDHCGASGCVNTNNTNPCSDGNACTVGDRCSGGSCGGGGARDCNDGNVCTADFCDPSSGCVNMNLAAGTSCGSPTCGPWDACSGVSCMPNAGTQRRECVPRECNGSGLCTTGSPFTDSRACTLAEGASCAVCNECGAGAPMLCDNGRCTAGCCSDMF